jgi:hypothetical protein
VNQDEFLSELKRRLLFRGASRKRARDVVAEARSHLTDSGEDPVDAFGKAGRVRRECVARLSVANRLGLIAMAMLVSIAWHRPRRVPR